MLLWEFVFLLTLANIIVYSIILPIFLKGSSKHVKMAMSGVFTIFVLTIIMLIFSSNLTILDLLISPLYFFLLMMIITVFSFVFIFIISLIVVWLHDKYL
ncbi:MAG: hypothetical protein ACP6IS_00410 [Candidatus Asgardarchaeia archaeon]